jgi:tetratricopeptide (TPR) repeat protein/DNA-binding CsgD family transcriptional regulator
MSILFDKPILCPILVGRASYLDLLKQHMNEARDGDGQTFLLAGEAGIGKSRLVAEAKAWAEQDGLLILQGNCFEPDRVLPYAPMLDLLRGFIAAHSVEKLKAFAAEFTKLIPELNVLLPDITQSPPLEPAQEKKRFFQTLDEFITGKNSKSLIIIEDLHWCDDTSLEFLLSFARDLSTHPILLVLTYRSDEMHPGLQHFLAELDRARLATEISLRRLQAPEVEEMIRVIFDQQGPVKDEFVRAIHTLTDGNPFFVEETLKSLVTSGDIYYANGGWTRKPVGDLHIPRTVQDAVQRRMRQLSDPARQLLALIAVAGRRFDFSLLQAVTGQTDSELLRSIRELFEAQLILEESSEQFAFRHALTRQAVYTDLLGRERRNLHSVIAKTLENRLDENASANSSIGDLSYHFFEAGLWEQAFNYARRAADHAQAMYTPRAAIEHLNRAIIASQHLSLTLPLELYRARGQHYQTLGDYESAQNDFQTVLDEAQAHHDQQVEWQALIDLGFLWAARDYTRTGDYFQQALVLAKYLDDSAALAHILNRVGNWHLNIDQLHEALRYHHEALRIFESLRDKPGLASTHDLLGITYYSSNDVHQGIAHYEQAIHLFRELDDRGGLASSLVLSASRGNEYIGSTAIPMRISLTERIEILQEALALALEADAKPAETLITIWLGMNLNASGNYSGFSHLREGLALAEAINHQHFVGIAHMILGMSYLEILAPKLARDHLERALHLAHTTNSMIWVGMINAYLALTDLYLGDFADAESKLEAALQTGTTFDTMGNCHLWAARAELLLAQGQADKALLMIERLISSLPNVDEEGEYSNARLSKLRGDILLALRRYASAEKALRGALASAQALDLKPQEWRAWKSLSRLYRTQGKLELAEEASIMAGTVIEEVAASLDGELRDPFQERATAQWKGLVILSRKEAGKRQFGGLTVREREVAGLIAAGKSNLEIAEALTLSHRTVEAHIGNILTKLQFNSRAQIAVWAVEKGLMPKTQ